MFLFILYYFLSPFIFISLIIFSVFNKKIRILLSDQKKSLLNINSKLNIDKKKIIIHAASAGEYEQIKPLLKTIDRNIYFIIVTCMSPTVYQSIKKDSLSDLSCYHPFDFPWSAKYFFKTIKPSIYLTTRHDIWPTHLYIAKKNNIKTVIINANLYSKSKRLKWYSLGFSKYLFNMFDLIIVPTERIKNIFKNSLDINSIDVICDTRFDQVLNRKKKSTEISKFESFGKNNIIFGSISWEDLEIISSTLQNESSDTIEEGIIIVPHEVNLKLIKNIEQICQDTKYFNKVKKLSDLKEDSNPRVIIVDKVGILPELYKYSRLAYIGGGFGGGVHSTIEPLVYHNIVCYGPNTDLLDEAKEMHQEGCGFIINNGFEFYNKYLETIDLNKTKNIKQSITKYLNKKKCSAEKIYKIISKNV
jgi:3-deoxy-D-manno-octulosonic-acid transferase